MPDLFLERSFEPRLTVPAVVAMVKEFGWCFEMYDVDWRGSLLSADGRRMLCRFSAADAESIRAALRKTGADTTRLWGGTVHDAPDPDVATVLVERSFAAPVAIGDLQAQEDAKIGCLETRRVAFVRSYFSHDRKRMICLYSGPDAESVREAQREAGMPVDRVWAFAYIGPEVLAA